MAGKNTTYVADQVAIVTASNSKGQVGIRNRFDEIAKKLTRGDALAWLEEHIAATKWFRALSSSNDWAVADTETTGTGSADQICELAIVRPKRVVFSRLLGTTVPVGRGATEKHGITNETLAGLPSFADLQSEIVASFDPLEDGELPITKLLWYNGDFDMRLKAQTAFAQGIPNPVWPEQIEVMDYVAVWCGSWNAREDSYRWPKLEGGHRAQGDCEYLIKYIEIMAGSDIDYAIELFKERSNG